MSSQMKNRKDKPEYKVVVNSNILRGNPIGSGLKEFINNWKNSENVKLQYFAPDVAIEEFIKYFILDVERFIL